MPSTFSNLEIYDRLNRIAGAFYPHEQAKPDLTMRVDSGAILNGTNVEEIPAQNSPVFSVPINSPRIDRVVIDSVGGNISVITGIEAESPVPPAISAGKLPVAQVYLTKETSVIKNQSIRDERVAFPIRPVFRGALALLIGNQFITNNVENVVNFEEKEYDTENIWGGAMNPSRFTVPVGVRNVRVIANVLFNQNGVGIRQLFIWKNGGIFRGETQVNQNAITVTSTRMHIASPVLMVNPGDYFEIAVSQTSGSLLDISDSWAAMEIIA